MIIITVIAYIYARTDNVMIYLFILLHGDCFAISFPMEKLSLLTVFLRLPNHAYFPSYGHCLNTLNVLSMVAKLTETYHLILYAGSPRRDMKLNMPPTFSFGGEAIDSILQNGVSVVDCEVS